MLFSILTPTWNRERYLERVHSGLMRQKFRDFEWVIADDGSIDNTSDVVKDLANRSDFKIIYIQANCHVGKVVMDNFAIKHAKGEFILWCDSDDFLMPQALHRLWETWKTIPENKLSEFVGLTALAASENKCIANPLPAKPYSDVSWNELSEIHHVTGDMLFCVRAEELKKHVFPEVDLVIPESVVWTAIGEGKTRLIPEELLMKEYRAEHAISFVPRMAYNRGRAYSLAITVRNLEHYERGLRYRTWQLITFIRYCIHGEISFASAWNLWSGNTNLFVYIWAMPFAWILAVKDCLQGKVIKTHREFNAAKTRAEFTVEVL